MKSIKVSLGSALLHPTDAAAGRAKVSRSALVREALREYLKRLETRERAPATATDTAGTPLCQTRCANRAEPSHKTTKCPCPEMFASDFVESFIEI